MAGVKTRGLERRREGATPNEGGMTLYLKAAEDGTSVGDCPFAHSVRMVLEEKGLTYELKPTAPEDKPDWLLEYYEGKMPALRHRKEAYVDSSVISEYVDFFFSAPDYTSLKVTNVEADDVLEGFFPAVAQYLKHVETEGEEHDEKLTNLQEKLGLLNQHFVVSSSEQAFLSGEDFSLADCRLVPQLYHLKVGIAAFKNDNPNLAQDYPELMAYYERASSRPSFQQTVYPEETIVWGWGNARN